MVSLFLIDIDMSIRLLEPSAQMAQELGLVCLCKWSQADRRKEKLLLPAVSLAVIRCAPISSAGMCRHTGLWSLDSCQCLSRKGALIQFTYASPPRTLQCADTCMLTSASNISFIHRVMAIIIHSSWLELLRKKVTSWSCHDSGAPGQAVGEPGGL